MQKLFNSKDTAFLMRTLIWSLMILALLHAFKPYFSESRAEPTMEAVEDLTRQTRFMSPNDVESFLKASQRPTMLVVYASWCGYCKKAMPHIYDLWRENKISGDQMLVISLDSQATTLSRYLLSYEFDKMLGAPIMLKKDASALARALKPTGSSYEGGIPYIGFFAPGGRLADEVVGYASKRDIEYALSNLK